MIFAQYEKDETTGTMVVGLSNSPVVNGTTANSTYHLENAIRKAVKNGLNRKLVIKLYDPANQYLRVVASILAVFAAASGMQDTAIE